MKSIRTLLMICSLSVSLLNAQAATLAHRYEFAGNVNDTTGTLNGTATTNLVNGDFALESPRYVNDVPDKADGPDRSIELGANSGRLKSGFHVPNGVIDRKEGSLSVWLKPSGASPANDVAIDYVLFLPKIGDGLFVAINPNSHADLAARIGSAKGVVKASGVISTGKWIHVVITWNKENELELYVDGTLQGHAPVEGFTSEASLRVGNFDFSGLGFLDAQYGGLLYDLQVYSGALSAENVSYLYNHPGGTASNPGTNTP